VVKATVRGLEAAQLQRTDYHPGGMMTLDESFAGREHSCRGFGDLKRAIDDLGPSALRATKS